MIGGLGDRDLDNIYKFVRQMKDTKIGECMLEDLVVKQACEADGKLSASMQLQDSYLFNTNSMDMSCSMNDRSARNRVRDFARSLSPIP